MKAIFKEDHVSAFNNDSCRSSFTQPEIEQSLVGGQITPQN